MSIPTPQAETAGLLGRLSGAAPIETHISAVFVGPDTAWKLKKAVALGFLDFSALAAREHFLRRELELNAALAPGLYRDVVSVTRGADGTLALAGQGAVVDWVLRMAPLPPGACLDAVAAAGGLIPKLLDALADAVVAMHAALPPVHEVDAPAELARVIAGNAQAARRAGLYAARVTGWAAAAEAARARLAPLLAARAAAGRVRRCHGDLHLGNLCLWQGRPTPFDALEFDEALAIIDIGYDLAFLLMDLDQRVDRAAANWVFNRVLARSSDYGVLPTLPLFLSLRALIRAHVMAARGASAEADTYLSAAEAYLRPVPTRLVAVGGLQGSGKSTLARRLAPGLGAAPGALVLRSDELRKRRHGLAPEARLPPEAYAPEASAAVFAELGARAGDALAAGHAVIADAAFLQPTERAAIGAVAPGAFTGFWLTAPLSVLRARVAARRDDASDANVAVLQAAAAGHTLPADWAVLDANGDPSAAALAMLDAGPPAAVVASPC